MESVFKYIFALIVGAMFIIFFVSFAMKYMGTAETMEANELVAGFDDYLLLRTGSRDATGPYDFSAQTTIEFDVGKIRSGTISRDTSRIVYAPAKLTGKSISIWTKRWAFPYPVDNFFYMTNDRVKHIIIYEPGSAEFVHELNDEINDSYRMDSPRKYEAGGTRGEAFNQYLTAVTSRYSTAAKIRFVVVSTGANAIVNAIKPKLPKNADIISVSKDPDAEGWEYGTVKFGDDEAPYIGNEMIIGAMFTEDFSNYEFNLKRAMQRLVDVTEIYTGKADYLEASIGANCGNDYNLMKSNLVNFKSAAEDRTLDINDVRLLVTRAEGIKEANKQSFGGGCPVIF
ncbi:MAG: hypothetical protein KJ955_00815 [Nanoarchaeota archaeon]|nr:hypothetical protein [Nanoarchaeota archaeon]